MKKLSIVIPSYNEERTILKILKKVNEVKLDNITKEIIIVDDGSKDSTQEILKKNKTLYQKLIIKKNGGKGSALRVGFKHVTGDFVVIQDADLEYDPEDYKKLLRPILKNKSQVVYGSRFLLKQKPVQKWGIPSHYIGNKLLSFFISIMFFKNISDMETCYKCFTSNVLKKLKLRENDFRIEPEITTQIIKNNFKIVEVPIVYHHRDFSEGKKINWVDGIKALIAIIKYRLIK